MISIGINFGYHESAVAISRDGEIIFAAAEERFTRIKQDSSFPIEAIKSGLKQLNISDKDVDVVALSWPMNTSSFLHDVKLFVTGQFSRTPSRLKKLIAQLFEIINARNKFKKLYQNYFEAPKNGFVFSDHHAAHALSAFYLADGDDPVCVVFDGRGTTEATTIWKFTDGKLTKLFERSFPKSIGVMYSNVTRLLGFKPLRDEWKVMGLAAYGNPNVDLSDFLDNQSKELIVQGEKFLPARDNEPSLFEKTFHVHHRGENEPIEDRHKDIAASAQLACEEAMISYVDLAVEIGNSKDVCLAGGVALNCKANGEILSRQNIDTLTVQPAAGDDGTAIGAALMGSITHGMSIQKNLLMSPYLGTEYSTEEIRDALNRAKIKYDEPNDLIKEVADALARDQLVGWFQGRMEFGPRALGGRSILANPTKVENRDRVNEAVKFREIWRPFAPAVLHEYGDKYFNDYQMSPYMIMSFWGNEYAKQSIPAVVHADGSCRVQSVTKQNNPIFYELILEFSRLTGVHVLMNTSFNLKGEPIVESPFDAIRTFYSSGLDLLAIGPFVVHK